MPNIQFSLYQGDDDRKVITAFVNGQLTAPADDSHPNFTNILAACQASLLGEDVDTDKFLDLFDVAKAVEREFSRLGERVTVKGNQILFDGDPVSGPLEDQILDFLNKGEDFAPLVKFYELLSSNPLGNVRDGLFTWIQGQKAEGNFTISEDGFIYGYKSVAPRAPEWRKDVGDTVYVPSQQSRDHDIVNGEEVPIGSFIEQVPGDVIEMPRSKVLNAPSQACGDGLHIGTWSYAKDFYGGSVVMLVKFSPRDIVSLPDGNSSWKLRVCRYTVIEQVTEPLQSALHVIEQPSEPEAPTGPQIGDQVKAVDDGEVGTLVSIDGDDVRVDFIGDPGSALKMKLDEIEPVDQPDVDLSIPSSDTDVKVGGPVKVGDTILLKSGAKSTVDSDQEGTDVDDDYDTEDGYVNVDEIQSISRKGYSGPTSYDAKGNGRNPAQDAKGQFSSGRPQAKRGADGRFVS